MRQLCFTGTKVDELVFLLCHMLKCKLCCSVHFFVVGLEMLSVSCDGREVKALDLKSNGVSPRRFDPCSQRSFGLYTIASGEWHVTAGFLRELLFPKSDPGFKYHSRQVCPYQWREVSVLLKKIGEEFPRATGGICEGRLLLTGFSKGTLPRVRIELTTFRL